MKNCLGIEIGHYRIKIAYAENGELREFISEDRPERYASICGFNKGFVEGVCDPLPERRVCHPAGGCVCAAL